MSEPVFINLTVSCCLRRVRFDELQVRVAVAE